MDDFPQQEAQSEIELDETILAPNLALPLWQQHMNAQEPVPEETIDVDIMHQVADAPPKPRSNNPIVSETTQEEDEFASQVSAELQKQTDQAAPDRHHSSSSTTSSPARQSRSTVGTDSTSVTSRHQHYLRSTPAQPRYEMRTRSVEAHAVTAVKSALHRSSSLPGHS